MNEFLQKTMKFKLHWNKNTYNPRDKKNIELGPENEKPKIN